MSILETFSLLGRLGLSSRIQSINRFSRGGVGNGFCGACGGETSSKIKHLQIKEVGISALFVDL